ncbi:serine/threonine/dual specificity protein kinase, catalytic domain-containing protein [Tanacetum coccineum]
MGSFRSKEDDVAKISTSIFVSNFPDSVSAKDLFHSCKQYGHVVDSFIPMKRLKDGKRFGFVRFINVFNVERLVNNLCTIWLNRCKLHANIARFNRDQKNGNKYKTANQKKHEGRKNTFYDPSKEAGTFDSRNSFVNVLKGTNMVKETDSSPVIVLEEDCLNSKDLSNSLIGRVKDVGSLSNLKKVLCNEGAARGLDYLHTGTGTKHGVTHRDVKTSNILLDQNFAAKIADFGLGPINQALTYISTGVKGTFGYMDPSYFYTGRLTRKSDVYAFGVVLLEVLCGRPALDESLDEGLAVWAQDRIKQGKVSQIIDPNLKDRISRSSLKEFSRIAARCVLSHPNQRPTMSGVVGCLDLALSIQKRKDLSPQRGILTRKIWSIISPKGTNGEIVSIPVPNLVTDPPEGQDANFDPLPAIHGFQIFGYAFPGGKLLARATVSMVQFGTYLCVEALPLDENGRMGSLFQCFANNGLLITHVSQ